MEHALTLTAVENDPDFLARVARRWIDALDQDGAEPSEERCAGSRASSSGNRGTGCIIWKSSPPPTSSSTWSR